MELQNGEFEELENKSGTSENETFPHFSIKECIIYFIFIIVFAAMCMTGRTYDSHNFWISNQLRLSLEGGVYTDNLDQGRLFADTTRKKDVELYVKQILMPLLYINETTSGKAINEEQYNFVLDQNKLLGGMRITMIRMNEEECLFKGLTAAFTPCYPEYSKNRVNTSDYQVGNLVMEYMSQSEGKSEDFYARMTENGYAGNGNVYDISPDKGTANAEINELFANDMIGRDARVVFFDFVTLNPNLNLHTVVRLCFEIPAEGGVATYSEIKTWRFWRYLGSRGKLLLATEVFVVLMVFFYTQEEVLEIFKQGFVNYKRSLWNLVDWVNLAFFYITIAWRIKVEINDKPTFTNLERYESYRAFVWNFSMEAYFNMVNGFLLTFKLFKYLNASRRIRLLFTLFKKTAGDILVFGIILFVIWLAYGVAGFLVFSSDVSDYRTLYFSIINLMRYTVTDMDYGILQQSNNMWGTIYYVSWTFLMFLVLVNVFVAILTDGYAACQEENKRLEPEKFTIGMFLPNKDTVMMRKIRSLIFREVDKDKDGILTAAELTSAHGKEEAKAILQIYDKDGDGNINEAEFEQMYEQKDGDHR